ncbi:MAG: glycosyltransferase [Pseudolabrys sp.]
MKVVLFVRSLAVGGTERQVVHLANGLARRRHDVTLVMLYGGGAAEKDIDNQYVKVIDVQKRGRWDVLGPLWRLRQAIAAERPDVLYAFLPMQNVLAALLRPFLPRTKLVFGARGSAFRIAAYDHLSAMSYRADAWLSHRADAIIANSYSFLQAARRYAPGKVVIVPNGIDVDRMCIDRDGKRRMRAVWNIGARAFVVGMVARLDPMKDHANFLAAAAQFAAAHADAHFVCVGGGDSGGYRGELETMARALGLAERVSFIGEQSDLAPIYNAFDIGTLSSAYGEGFSNVIGEAMACGLPMAVTDVGDAARIVGPHGIVVPPGDPQRLSEAWGQLRQRQANEPNLAVAVRAHIVDRYSIESMVDKTERILTQVCEGRPFAADAA